MDIRITMTQRRDGRWLGRSVGEPAVSASGSTKDRCLANLRRSLDRALGATGTRPTIIVETVPLMAGVAEAAEVMGWDKRRVITYIDRGSFPQPIQSLASGRVWLRSDIEAFAKEWRARQKKRLRTRRR
jgi:predicted DNA-binding transcriptional regulator AlpA/predicted RNase H-like HicB family nuclease